LRAAAAGTPPIKWKQKDVQGFVRDGQGFESRVVRDGLAEQTLIITDPLDLIRELDVGLFNKGRVGVPFCSMVFLTKQNIPAWVQEFASSLRRGVSLDLLGQSGIGRVESLLDDAMSNGVFSRQASLLLPYGVVGMMERCDGQLSKVAKLATQATALVAEERDPDANCELEGEGFGTLRTIDGRTNPYDARRSLRNIAGSNILFDRDEPGITGMVEEVRMVAQRTGSLDFPGLGGSIRTGDDSEHLRIQLADVAAGWASTVVHERGFRSLAETFRYILYNGQPLTLDSAAELDRTRDLHRSLLADAQPLDLRS
jgi:hypothetical protein